MLCGLVRDREIFGKADRGMLGRGISRAADLRQQPRGRDRVEEIAAAARLHAGDEMPRRIDMGHDVDRPAALPWLVGIAAGIDRHRIEAAADAGIGAEQFDRAELPLGLLDDVGDLLFLRDVASEGRAIHRRSDRPCIVGVHVGDDDLGRARLVKSLAQRLADAVGAARDDHDLAGHLHATSPLVLYRFAYSASRSLLSSTRGRAPRYNGTPHRPRQSRARSHSGSAAAARHGRSRQSCRAGRPQG